MSSTFLAIPPRGRSVIRAVLAALATAVLLLVGAGPAAAHATFLGVDPADGTVLATAPATITLTFNEPVTVRDGGVRLLDAAGTEQPVTVQSIDATVVITPGALGDGTFIVSWRVISPDSHPVTGGSTFSIGAPSSQVVAAPSVDVDAAVQWTAAGAQALTYLGVLGAAGLTAFELLVLRGSPAPGRAGRRRATGLFAVAGVSGAVLVVPMTALRQGGGTVSGLLDPATWSDSPTDGPWLAALLVAAGCAALWWSAWHTGRPLGSGRSAAAMAGAGVALGALAIVGHTRAFGPPALVVAADLLHLTVGAFWFGGLIALTITLAAGTSGSPNTIAAVLQRFSAMAAFLVAILAITGVLLGWRVLGSFEALFGTAYGVTLLVKLTVVIPVLGIAGWNRFRLLPVVAAAPDATVGWSRLKITIRLEAGLLVAVLAVTGVLVNSNPVLPTAASTAATTPAAAPIAMSTPLGAGAVAIVLTPGTLGVNALEFRITDAAGVPLEPLADPTVRVSMPAADIGPLTRPATRTGPGSYQATLDLPLAGEWEIEIGARTSQFESPLATVPVQIR